MQRKTKMDGEPGKKIIKKGKIARKKMKGEDYKKKIYVYLDMAVDIDIDLIEICWQPLFLIKWY